MVVSVGFIDNALVAVLFFDPQQKYSSISLKINSDIFTIPSPCSQLPGKPLCNKTALKCCTNTPTLKLVIVIIGVSIVIVITLKCAGLFLASMFITHVFSVVCTAM